MTLRIEVIDPYGGDRDPGDWALAIEFEWFSRGAWNPQKSGFRGLSLTFGRRTLLIGQEIKP